MKASMAKKAPMISGMPMRIRNKIDSRTSVLAVMVNMMLVPFRVLVGTAHESIAFTHPTTTEIGICGPVGRSSAQMT